MSRFSRFILFLYAASFISSVCLAQNISGPQSGTLGPGTFNVTGSIQVLYGQSLYIQPGTEFVFAGDYDFDVYGHLYAVGTETDSIIFRAGSVEGWNGIDINSLATDSTILKYCCIYESNGVGLYITDASPTIDRCILRGNISGTG